MVRKVSRYKLRRLYTGDARGVRDEDLVNEVAYGLYARCQHLLASEGESTPARPKRRQVQVTERPARWEGFVKRARYPWEIAWQAEFEDYQQAAGGASEAMAYFVAHLPLARSPREKMLLINRLTHECHNSLKAPGTDTPLAVQLITGSPENLLALLNGLAYDN